MPIDQNLIDVVPDQWRPGDQFGGWIESEEDLTFGADFPDTFLVPRSEWKDRCAERKKLGYSLGNFYGYVYNQSPESSCVHNSAAACMGIRRCVSLGEKYRIVTSPMSSYSQVARSRNSGSTMWGAMEYLTEHGQLPASTFGQDKIFKHTFHENTPFNRKLPDGWEVTARHFRVMPDGWFKISSREQFASALFNDMPICYGRRGHSICAEDVIDEGKRFLVSYRDSYSTKRGNNGRLYDTESNWGTGGAWCCHSVRLPSDPKKPAGADGGVLTV